MMDDSEHQSPSSNKKRKSAVALPSQKRCLIKNTKIPENLAGTCALSRSPSKISFISSPTSSNQAARIPSAKNAKAGPSTSPNATSHSRDLTVPTRVSSRVSRPTFKKMALPVKKPRLPESDGTPPLSIILPPSQKQKKPASSPTKKLAGNKTPSKRKWLDPNPIELTSSDDDSRPQPPRKRIKHAHKKAEVIDLCSESEEIESVFQALPPPLAHNTPVPKPKALVSEEDGVRDESNKCAEKVDLPRGSLQVLYNEALTRCTQKPRCEKDISDHPSPFLSLKCVPPARIIRYATQAQSPRLHTPLFFSRIRLKQPKTLDAKAFSDARVSFSNPKAFPDASTFSAISNDTDLNSMEVSKLNENEDTLTYPDAAMELSAVDSKALEIATETIPIPPTIDFPDDTSSDTQVAGISPSIVNSMDVNERLVSRSLGSPSPLPNQESPFRQGVTILEDTPILHGIQAQTVICRPITPDRAHSFAIRPNMLCDTDTPSNLDAVNHQIETTQEAEAFLFERESCVEQIAKIEPIVLDDTQSFVQALQRIYDVSNIYEFSVHPALELNIGKPSAVFDPLSESPTEYESITNISSVAISSSVHTLSASKYPPELSVEQKMTLNLSSPASSKDVSSGFEGPSESPAILNLYPLTSSSSTDTLSSRASSLSTRSLQSLDSSASIESVNCHLLTPDDTLSPLTPLVKAQKRESSLIYSKPLSSSIGTFFDMDMSELNLQTIMCNMLDEDDDDDDISISGMELTYPEESHTI